MDLTIPAGVTFHDLQLEREPATGRLLFAPAPIAEVCRLNAMDPEAILADEDLSCFLICQWYLIHRLADGIPDLVVERLLVEMAKLQESGMAALQPGSGPAH